MRIAFRVILSLTFLLGMFPRLAIADDGPLLLAASAPLPTTPGDYRFIFETKIGDRSIRMSYLLRLPTGYSDSPKKFPLLVFFHGIGEVGTDLGGVYAIGPLPQIRDIGNGAFAKSFPFVLLAPQCPPDGTRWETEEIYKAAIQLIQQIIKKTRVDPDRVYATGLSMGGDGTWDVAIEAPNLFAAIAPLSPMAVRPDMAAARLKYVSVWCTDGILDQPRFIDGTRQMEAALSNNARDHRFTYFLGIGHEAWVFPWPNPQFYEWMLAHHRPDPAERKKIDEAGPYTIAPDPIPKIAGHYLLNFDTMIGNQPYQIDYLLYLPKGYKPTGTPRAALLFLHEENVIGRDINGLCPHGPDLALELKGEGLKENFPFVVISPRLPIRCDWTTPGIAEAIVNLLDHVQAEVNVDKSKVIATGLNLGAAGVWNLAKQSPTRFAAIAPIVAEGQFFPNDDQARLMATIPGWAFIPKADPGGVDRMKSLVAHAKATWSFSVLPATATAGSIPTYSDPQFLAWLRKQHR